MGFAGTFIFLVIVYRQRNRISIARKRSDDLLLNILPEEVAQELKEKGSSEAQLIEHVTVLFTDFKGFTRMSEQLTPKELVKELNTCFSEFDQIIDKFGVEKIKTIGDSYMAAGGLPTPNTTHVTDVLQAAFAMLDLIEAGKHKMIAEGRPFFEIRIGIHTGPVVAGIVGVKKFQYDIWGDTVNTASRMESSGEVGRVNVSQATYDLLKENENFSFISRGKIEAKGKGEIEMYFVKQEN
jgi:adenylate cyclase